MSTQHDELEVRDMDLKDAGILISFGVAVLAFLRTVFSDRSDTPTRKEMKNDIASTENRIMRRIDALHADVRALIIRNGHK